MSYLNPNQIVVHRAQLTPSEKENTLLGLHCCLAAGFSVEIDAHFFRGEIYLGHDVGSQAVTMDEIDHPNVFVHFKTPECPDLKRADCFYIERDPLVFTKRGKKWLNVGTDLFEPGAVLCSNELIGRPNDYEKNKKMVLSGGSVCTKSASALADSLLLHTSKD